MSTVFSNLQFNFSITKFPIHLLAILAFYIYSDFSFINDYFCLAILIVTQLFYTIFQFKNSNAKVSGKVSKNKKKKSSNSNKSSINISLILVLPIICLILAMPISCILILFGAPFGEYINLTIIASSHISFLLAPIVFKLLNGEITVEASYIYIIPIALGIWLSSIVVPLDWDRPWQLYPIPIIISAYISSIVSYTIF